MKFWSDIEVNMLIDDISVAAYEAVEQATAEAAKAAILTSLEREAEAWRETQHWRLEAEKLKKAGIKNAVITGIICFAGGIIFGITMRN
jgi:hypothetical protein